MNPYRGQIELFAFSQIPTGWLPCDGRLMAINTNQPLFSILGTTYGGDGRVNFALPDLRGRVPIGIGNGHVFGEVGGEETHTLSGPEIGLHTHVIRVDDSADASTEVPSSAVVLGRSVGKQNPTGTFNVYIYGSATPDPSKALDRSTMSGPGNGHENRMPYVAMNYCICVSGN